MEEYLAACNEAADYPRNLLQPCRFGFHLEAHHERLSKRAQKLFHQRPNSCVKFLNFGKNGQ